ncbi:MAG: beta-lactamase family protein [Deinococcota bacterium]|nr:beta-lactamase family protein [Deinococcota bacterium]
MRRVVEEAVGRDEVPSVVAMVGTASTRHLVTAAGRRETWSEGAAVDRSTVYDLASLTKVVATLPAVLKLIDSGEIRLGSRIADFFTNAGWFQSPSLADVTVESLLSHSSGLPAWKPLFAWASKRETAMANVLQSGLEHPAGSYVYSDLGFILLGAIVERVSGLRLDAFVRQEIFEPLGMKETRFGSLQEENVAATEDCGWRNMRLQGVVHDENAYVLDGIAGHAGLFGTADDLATYAQAWLSRDARLASEEMLALATREYVRDEEARRGLGWILWTEPSSAGRYAGPEAYGHTGFTGTSLWLNPGSKGPSGPNPDNDWFAVLLTNRVHPSRTCGQNIHALRVAFHEAVGESFRGLNGKLPSEVMV